MKTILIPTDGSPATDKVLEIASAIAATTSAKIQLLPVTDFISHNQFSGMPVQAADKISNKTHVIELLDESSRKPDEAPATAEIVGQIEIGGEVKSILDTSISKEVDLVIISANLISGRHELSADSAGEGTKGAAPSMEIIMDANAEGTKGASAAHEIPLEPVVARAVKFAHCPVLTITHPVENFDIKNVVAVINFEEGSAPLFRSISQFQAHFNWKVYLLYVNTWYHHKPADVLEIKMQELADTYALKNWTSHILDDYTYEEGVIHFSQKVQADMIAIPIDKHQDISRLLSENLTAGATHHQASFLLTFTIE